MTVGIGLCSAPGTALTAEDVEFADDFLLLDLTVTFGAAEETSASLASATLPAFCLESFFLPFAAGFFSALFASSAVKAFRLESARAIASASHPALTFPRDAGRLLVHSADPASPAICAIVRPVRTEVSYSSMLNPATT
jgi:hypothetical protein